MNFFKVKYDNKKINKNNKTLEHKTLKYDIYNKYPIEIIFNKPSIKIILQFQDRLKKYNINCSIDEINNFVINNCPCKYKYPDYFSKKYILTEYELGLKSKYYLDLFLKKSFYI